METRQKNNTVFGDARRKESTGFVGRDGGVKFERDKISIVLKF